MAAGKKGTPGRPKKRGTQFWDIGKVGRKTGITLEDKGVRDEHGLEPMEHIFSSPVRKVDSAAGSSESVMHESSGPEVDVTLTSRKTPRLPPPRASTPKYTNIGSPKRMSTGRARAQATNGLADSSPDRTRTQPPANRVLDFNVDNVHKSIEKPSPSPFKPKHALRRSGVMHEPFPSPIKAAEPVPEIEEEEEIVKYGQDDYDAPIMVDDDDYHVPILGDEVEATLEDTRGGAYEDSPSNAPASRGRPSGIPANSSELQPSPIASAPASSKKRPREQVEDEPVEAEASLSRSPTPTAGPAQKKQRGKNSKKVTIHHRNGEDETIDPALLAYGDSYEADPSLEAALAKPAKGKGKKGKALKEKDRNQSVTARGSPVKLNDSPSKTRPSRERSTGPVNNFHLRATTPFEDAGSRVSRFGRNLIKPLQYWANEARIYKRGEIEGIVRAEEVEKTKPKKKGRKKKRGTKLDDIDEEGESDAESVLPDEWEDDVGVISGMVASWDPMLQQGVPEDLIKEDLGFAVTSIATREVKGSDFRYAKVMTLPFFGSGIVELPPEACKRTKNSRKMQMCFFVHEGKVMVEIGATGATDVTQFAISKGGVWVVPRGNNYAITNESKTRTARIFFAQGNEVEALANAPVGADASAE